MKGKMARVSFTVFLTALVALVRGQIDPNQLKCFNNNCSTIFSSLDHCAQGEWLCPQGQFCEVAVKHIGGFFLGSLPYPSAVCVSSLTECLAKYENNHDYCDPTTQRHDCYWCCDSAACVHNLIAGQPYTPPSV